jgi:general secretion pathway protein L
MSDRVFCRRLDGGDQYEWVRVDAAGRVAANGKGPAPELARAAGQAPVTLIVNGAQVRLLEVTVPARSRKVLKQALPFTVEEFIATDAEGIAIGVGPATGKHRYPTAVMQKGALDTAIGELAAAGVAPTAVIPDLLCAPFAPGRTTIMIENGSALVRDGWFSGFKVARDTLPIVLDLMPKEASSEAAGDAIVYLCDDAADADIDALKRRFERVEVDRSRGGVPLGFLASSLDPAHAIDFLSEPHKAGLPKSVRIGALAAAIAGAALATHLGFQIWHTARLDRASEALASQAEERFRQLFPDTRRIVDVRAQAEQNLREARAAGKTSLDFLGVLYRLGAAMQGHDNLRLTGVTYAPDLVSVTLAADTIETVEAYTNRVSTEGMALSLMSAESADQGEISAQLRITGR